MIKVITSMSSATTAGDEMTETISKWMANLSADIEIKTVHSNSNKFGWMIVIEYEWAFSEAD